MLVLLLLITIVINTHSQTTQNIDQICVGRCYDTSNTYGSIDCKSLYSLFYEAVGYKNANNVIMSDFNVMFDWIPPHAISAPIDRTLFWSGSNRVAHLMSNSFPQKYVTLEDTIVGRTFNGLLFCGCSSEESNTTCSSDGYDYVNACQFGYFTNRTDVHGAGTSFWASASTNYAKNARGAVTALLNGQRHQAYSNSFFRNFEVANLNSSQITSVTILLIKNETSGETCNSGSLLDLYSDLNSKLRKDLGHERNHPLIKCIDDLPTVQYILCSDNPASKECAFVQSFYKTYRMRIGFVSTSMFILGSIAGIIVTVVLQMIISGYKKRIYAKSEPLIGN